MTDPVGTPLIDVMPSMPDPGKELLAVRDLRAVFETEDGCVQAVDGVSFSIDRGEIWIRRRSVGGYSATVFPDAVTTLSTICGTHRFPPLASAP